MNVQDIFTRFYSGNMELLSTVTVHSECVARKALHCLKSRGIDADLDFVWEAALLHDIGVVRCHAPSIHCHGTLPYICHGIEGRKMLDGIGLYRHGLVCERHTGAGLSADDIAAQSLPLPHRDMLPVSIEEKVICYADKFFSKSGNLSEEKSFEKVTAQMESHGEESLRRFLLLHSIFG
ncbi:MAG: phosphohydrolase [Muribaculaceae bacterium]|nr:phosphohydrolase [Muribaculaceae bacterium]